MELYQLEYFVAVVEEGSFTRAAKRCYISQPALSQQIQKLERELGQKLLQRLTRRIELTDAGRVLYEKARSILELARQVQGELSELSTQPSGRLIVGAIPTVAPYVLPELVQRFQAEFPGAELFIHEDVTESLLAGTERGDIDLALVALPIEHDQLLAEQLWTEPLLLALPANHRLARKRTIRLADIANEPFILLDEMHCLGRQIIDFCNRQAYSPQVCCRSAQLLTVQRMVALGHGISLIPEMAARANSVDGVRYRELHDARPTRTLAAVWHKHRFQSGLARGWLELLRKWEVATRTAAKGER